MLVNADDEDTVEAPTKDPQTKPESSSEIESGEYRCWATLPGKWST